MFIHRSARDDSVLIYKKARNENTKTLKFVTKKIRIFGKISQESIKHRDTNFVYKLMTTFFNLCNRQDSRQNLKINSN